MYEGCNLIQFFGCQIGHGFMEVHMEGIHDELSMNVEFFLYLIRWEMMEGTLQIVRMNGATMRQHDVLDLLRQVHLCLSIIGQVVLP